MTRPQNLSTETVLTASTIGLVTVLSLYWYQKRKYTLPTIWEPVGKVKGLFIYPLKSGHRIELQRAICTEYGMLMPKAGACYQFYDRNLAVYKEDDNQVKTAKQHPKMLFIKAAPYPADPNYFTLNAPGMPALKVKIPTPKDSEEGEILFPKREKIYTLDCGDQASIWISNYILGTNSGLRLGYHDAGRRRNIYNTHHKLLKIYPRYRNAAMGLYTDYTSYSVMNQASVDALNNKIPDDNITVHNFRPNILVEGINATPYAEDNWNWMKIGNVTLYFAKPCTRCILTTIDPDTGLKSESMEPLKTLRIFRLLRDIKNNDLEGDLPVIGNHMGLQTGGEISLGDTVYVGRD